jgi:hypothetical protein
MVVVEATVAKISPALSTLGLTIAINSPIAMLAKNNPVKVTQKKKNRPALYLTELKTGHQKHTANAKSNKLERIKQSSPK